MKTEQTTLVGLDTASKPDTAGAFIWGKPAPDLPHYALAIVSKGWQVLPEGAQLAFGDRMFTGEAHGFKSLSRFAIASVSRVLPGEVVIRHPHVFYVLNLQGLSALSIKQPWAWFIVRPDLAALARKHSTELKTVENREWNTRNPGRKFRGRVLIHASLGCTKQEYADAVVFAREAGMKADIPPLEQMPRGGVVGVASVIDWVEDAHDGYHRTLHSSDPKKSLWYVGPGALVLKDVTPLPFTPCKGALGFFKPQFDAALTTEPESV